MNPSPPSLDAFDFNYLFGLDPANNHQDDLEHGLAVIRAHGAAVARHDVRAALKFQFRELDSCIHPDNRNGSTGKHIDRFQATRLGLDAYQRMSPRSARKAC